MNETVDPQAKRVRIRGQSGIEFLAVTAVGLLMITGISIFLLGQTQSEQDSVTLQQTQQVMTVLASRAQQVWARGPNNWDTVDVTLPSNVANISTVENNTLIIDIDTVYAGRITQPYFMPVPISGGYGTDGERTAVFQPGSERGGPISIRVSSNGTAVIFSVQ